MEKLPRTQYSPECREQAVRTYRESGLSLGVAAKQLSLPKGTLKNWVHAANQGKLAGIGKHQKPLTEMELELSRLKRELAETKMERDFIKNVRPISRRKSAAKDAAVKYGHIKTLRQVYPVALMCRALNVSESGFHA